MRTTRSVAVAILALAAAVPTQASAGNLTWLSGRWCGGAGSERVEEIWLEPNGEHLLGVSRTTKDGQLASFEFLRIGPGDRVPTYFAQPGGRPPTAFAHTDGGDAWVRFENPAHDFPQRIEYRRDGDRLRAEIAGPGDDGKELVIGFDYTRCGE